MYNQYDVRNYMEDGPFDTGAHQESRKRLDDIRKGKIIKQKPHEFLGPPKIDPQKDLVVATDKGSEAMEKSFA